MTEAIQLSSLARAKSVVSTGAVLERGVRRDEYFADDVISIMTKMSVSLSALSEIFCLVERWCLELKCEER